MNLRSSLRSAAPLAAAALLAAGSLSGCATEQLELAEPEIATSFEEMPEQTEEAAAPETTAEAVREEETAVVTQTVTQVQPENISQGTYGDKATDPNWGVKRDADGIITEVKWEGFARSISIPACDGRNILILHSVIDEGDLGYTHSELSSNVAYGGGGNAEYTYPGQCPSLRSHVDGKRIYPVYLDFGSDVNGMCAAKAKYGGNGRVLSNTAEFVDPC